MDAKRLLITGVSGLLGSNLAYYFRDHYNILGLYNTYPFALKGIRTVACDLNDFDNVDRIVEQFKPDIIIHCASLTDIDLCEKDQESTRRINVDATKNLVELFGNNDGKLVYISTDAVYNGVTGTFSEYDGIEPKNYYGQTKLEGEQEVLKIPNSLILRTNIFGWNVQEKESLGEWIVRSLTNGNRIKGFTDAIFSTIYTLELARIVKMALKSDLIGLFNCGSIDSCSKYEFAMKLANRFNLNADLIEPISILEYGFSGTRGLNLSMNVEKLSQVMAYRPPSIEFSIDMFYRDFCSGLPEEIQSFHQPFPRKRDFISYGQQSIDQNDIHAVESVLRSAWITQGPKVGEFEEALAEYCDAGYAVVVNSGTSALHIACLAAGIKNGQEVVTSPNTFVASANCVGYCGGKPVFSDIDLITYNIDPDHIKNKINQNTRGFIPVHFAGQSCDMEHIAETVNQAQIKYGHKIWIIEDASHALGSIYKGARVGSCAFSDMTVISFHPVKHITTGEGGAVLTNDEILYKRLKRLRSHGITNSPEEFSYPEQAFTDARSRGLNAMNPWYYEQKELGYNYRITDIQCALGLSQLEKMDQFINRRREIVQRYNHFFSGIDAIQIPFENTECISNFHLYVLLIDFDGIGTQRAEFITALKQVGIQTQVHYIPVHTQPFYQEQYGTRWGDYPNAETYYRKCLSIPLYPAMTNKDCDKVADNVRNLVSQNI